MTAEAPPVPLLVITGPTGAGKSTVGGEVFRLLREAGARRLVVSRVLAARSLLRHIEAVPGAHRGPHPSPT